MNLDALGDCLDNLDGLWENTTNKKSGTRSTGGVPPHWMEIPVNVFFAFAAWTQKSRVFFIFMC